MATGAKMSFNYYQNGKFGTLPQNPQKDLEVTQDMHLKMSKKIAQLTKVIYALNTKNDEHDAILLSLKEKYEDEKQQIICETKAKIATYKQKVGGDIDYCKRIDTLENCLSEHQKSKISALHEFDAYKKEAEAREFEMKTEHAQNVLKLSQDVLKAKKDFEEKLKMIDKFKEQSEKEKQDALEQLKIQHKKEMENALQNNKALFDLQEAKDAQDAKYKAELEVLQSKINELNDQMAHMTEDYELKLNKAQAFFDKEMAVLKESQQASHSEQVNRLQEQYDKMKKDLQFQETQSKQRIDDLINKLSLSEEEVESLKSEMDKLQSNLSHKASDSSNLLKQLQNAKHETTMIRTKLKEVETELTASRHRVDEQAQDLMKKSRTIGSLEASKLQNESTIKDLQAELNKVKDRVAWLEGAKKSLEDKGHLQSKEQLSQLKSLEKALEDMSTQKQTMSEKYEREIKALRDGTNQGEDEMRRKHREEMEDLKQLHAAELGNTKRQTEENFKQLKEKLEAELEEERKQLAEEKEKMIEQFEQMKAELTNKLHHAEDEVARLNKIVEQSEQGLGSASTQINSLKEQADKLKIDLDATRAELRVSRSQTASTKTELEKLKLLHETKMKEAEVELKNKLDQLSVDLDTKWTDTLRKECYKLRQEITAQKEEDKRAALEQLSKMKDEELGFAKTGWESKVQELLKEISKLKSALDAQQSNASSKMEDIKVQAEAENQRLMQELLKSAEEYAKKMEAMEQNYQEKLRIISENKNQDQKEIEQRMKEKHMEDMSAQLTAHRAAVETLKQRAENEKIQEIEELRQKLKDEIDSLQTELEHRHSMDIEETTREHNMQLQVARMELERAMELTKQKEGEHAMRISDLEEDIRHKNMTIKHMEDEVQKLQTGVNDLSREIEIKGKEILKIRSEANQNLKAREEKLKRRYHEEISNLQTDHAKESEDMLAEFTQAQELLKEKIETLQLMLEEAEDRYRDRESRPEDIDLISQLQQAILDKQLAMKQLVDDKKFYQMELVNRETNFNKVFNSDPKIGVLNPLQVGKKSKSGKGTSSGRLDPLPGSPIHDGKFNATKPLPPPKKFMK